MGSPASDQSATPAALAIVSTFLLSLTTPSWSVTPGHSGSLLMQQSRTLPQCFTGSLARFRQSLQIAPRLTKSFDPSGVGTS